MIALLILGSATLLFSCSKKPKSVEYDLETLMTESSEHRTISMIEDGRCSYTFSAPLIEGYSMATNPYQEFRRGIELTTYRQDTITVVSDTVYMANQVESVITANYAIYYEKQDLWEAKGDVVVIKNERDPGDTLVKGTTQVYTQQLYWDATLGKIYSNVDTRVVTPEGPQYGEGFDTDEGLKEIHFRKYLGEVEFDFTPVKRDSVGRAKQDAKQKSNTPAKGNNRNDANKLDNVVRPDRLDRPDLNGTMKPKTDGSRSVSAPIRGVEQMQHTVDGERPNMDRQPVMSHQSLVPPTADRKSESETPSGPKSRDRVDGDIKSMEMGVDVNLRSDL